MLVICPRRNRKEEHCDYRCEEAVHDDLSCGPWGLRWSKIG